MIRYAHPRGPGGAPCCIAYPRSPPFSCCLVRHGAPPVRAQDDFTYFLDDLYDWGRYLSLGHFALVILLLAPRMPPSQPATVSTAVRCCWGWPPRCAGPDIFRTDCRCSCKRWSRPWTIRLGWSPQRWEPWASRTGIRWATAWSMRTWSASSIARWCCLGERDQRRDAINRAQRPGQAAHLSRSPRAARPGRS